MVIYPVDSAIQRLMNLGQVKMNLLLNSWLANQKSDI